MNTIFRCLGSFAILIGLCGGAFASNTNENELPFEINEWLNGQDREDFSWDVRVSDPFLTFQQRYGVRIQAFFYIRSDMVRDRTIPQYLHFVLKVATYDNEWVPGFSHTSIPFPSEEDKYQTLRFTDSVYLRPGIYTIALIACDPILKKGNVWRKRVKISPIGGDRLPELDRDLPNVQFTSEDRILATGSEWLPVKNNRSLCIDIVANISMDWHHDPRLGRHYVGFGISHLLPSSDNSVPILEVASVLSHLAVHKGRVRVSIVDPLRIKTLYSREDAASFDWQQASQFAKTEFSFTVDIDQLAARTQASAYLQDKLKEILEDNGCTSDIQTSLKAVIVVGTDMVFAENTPIRQIAAQDTASVRFFYFKIPKGIPSNDDLPKMLREADPKAFTVSDGFSFRKDLADLISRLEKFAK